MTESKLPELTPDEMFKKTFKRLQEGMDEMYGKLMETVTLAEKLASVKRELALRKGVYPKWVEQKRMKKEKADHEILVMASICTDYEAACAAGRKENPGDFQHALKVIGDVQNKAYERAIGIIECGGSPQEMVARIRAAMAAS